MRWLLWIVAAAVLWFIGFQIAAFVPSEWAVAVTMGVLVLGLAAVNWVVERTVGRPPDRRDEGPSDEPAHPNG